MSEADKDDPFKGLVTSNELNLEHERKSREFSEREHAFEEREEEEQRRRGRRDDD